MVRVLVPRASWSEALERPSVKPSGENVNRRVGPASDTPAAAGPGADQSGGEPLVGAMMSAVESMESVSTCPRAMAMRRAR